MCDIVELFAIAREEDGACAGSITTPNDITPYIRRAVCRCGLERLVETTVTRG